MPTPPPIPAPSSGYVVYDDLSSFQSKVWKISAYKSLTKFIDNTFRASDVGFADGKLVIQSNVDDHVGGEYKTKNVLTYGKYRASMRLRQTQGTYINFFSYMWPGGNGGEKHNEIDIELFRDGTVYSAMFTTWYNGVRNYMAYKLPFDPGDCYHIYGYDWYPDHVDFYIDDALIWTSTSRIPSQPMWLYFNSWVLRGPPADHGNGLNTQWVDWVTVEKI